MAHASLLFIGKTDIYQFLTGISLLMSNHFSSPLLNILFPEFSFNKKSLNLSEDSPLNYV